jgi:hypothetical protein
MGDERAGPADPARVPLGLEVSEADAARIDQVLARPEFAGWTRSEWCREIIRSALRYYVGDPPAPAGASSPVPAADPPGATVPGATAPVPAEPEPPAQPECSHPADARDYQTGTCAACGAILWD